MNPASKQQIVLVHGRGAKPNAQALQELWTDALVAGLLGFYLGLLYLETDNLVVPMVVHSLYDFFALVYLVRWRAKRMKRVDGPDR